MQSPAADTSASPDAVSCESMSLLRSSGSMITYETAGVYVWLGRSRRFPNVWLKVFCKMMKYYVMML